MTDTEHLEQRIEKLERAIRRRSWALLGALGLAIALFATGSFAVPAPGIADELRTRRLVVVDGQDRMRIKIGEDAENVDRYARAAGITIYDDKGSERGGMGTLADGSAVIALDAPHGVGSPMPDRAGMKVAADGTALIAVISNKGDFAAALQSDGAAGRVELYNARRDDQEPQARTLTFGGDTTGELDTPQGSNPAE